MKKNKKNYEVVWFTPTLNELLEIQIQNFNNGWGYSHLFKDELRRHGITNMECLREDLNLFVNIIRNNAYLLPSKKILGIRNKTNGEFIHRGYIGIYSYHPSEGYIIFHIECERDFVWIPQSFQIVSLKNGEEIGENLVEYSTSNIKDLNFFGITASSIIDHPGLYKIDENINDFIPIEWNTNNDFKIEMSKIGLSSPNWKKLKKYKFKHIESLNPFYKDSKYQNYIPIIPINKNLDDELPF